MQSAGSLARLWFDVRAPVSFRSREGRGLGLATHLSAVGAVIERATARLSPGERVKLELGLLPNHPQLRLSGEVVRRTHDGFAVRFALLSPRAIRLLEDQLAKAEASEEP